MSTTRPGRPPGVRLDGARLRERRHAVAMTQAHLATLAGLTARTLQSAERGKPISLHNAFSLARVLGVPLNAILHASPDSLRERLATGGYLPLAPPDLAPHFPDGVIHLVDEVAHPGLRSVRPDPLERAVAPLVGGRSCPSGRSRSRQAAKRSAGAARPHTGTTVTLTLLDPRAQRAARAFGATGDFTS